MITEIVRTNTRPVRLLVRLPVLQTGQVGFESHTGQSVIRGEGHRSPACLGSKARRRAKARMKAEATVVERRSKADVPRIGIVGSSPTASALKNNTCPWPIGRGVSLPSWIGGFDSRRALSIGLVAQRQSRSLLSTSAWVRVPPFPFSLRGSFCWYKFVALNPLLWLSPSALIWLDGQRLQLMVRFLPPQFVNFSIEVVSFNSQSLRDSRCW